MSFPAFPGARRDNSRPDRWGDMGFNIKLAGFPVCVISWLWSLAGCIVRFCSCLCRKHPGGVLDLLYQRTSSTKVLLVNLLMKWMDFMAIPRTLLDLCCSKAKCLLHFVLLVLLRDKEKDEEDLDEGQRSSGRSVPEDFGFEHVCNDTDRRNNLKQYCTCKYCTLYIIISLYLDYTNIMHIK